MWRLFFVCKHSLKCNKLSHQTRFKTSHRTVSSITTKQIIQHLTRQAKKSGIESSVNFFKTIPKRHITPNIVRSMLKLYLKYDKTMEAGALLKRAILLGFKPRPEELNRFIMVCHKKKDLRTANFILLYIMPLTDIPFNQTTICLLLATQISEKKSKELIMMLFRSIPIELKSPTAYYMIIQLLIENDDMKTAKEMYQDMIEFETIDDRTLVYIINACILLKDVDKLIELYKSLSDSQTPLNADNFQRLLGGFLKFGNIQYAELLFNQYMISPTLCWIMINESVYNRYLDLPTRYLQIAVEHGFTPSLVTLKRVLEMYLQMNRLQRAIDMTKYAPKEHLPELYKYIFNHCISHEQFKLFTKLFLQKWDQDMHILGVSDLLANIPLRYLRFMLSQAKRVQHVLIYTTIESLIKHNRLQDAIEIFNHYKWIMNDDIRQLLEQTCSQHAIKLQKIGKTYKIKQIG